jgi:hypothetical protein
MNDNVGGHVELTDLVPVLDYSIVSESVTSSPHRNQDTNVRHTGAILTSTKEKDAYLASSGLTHFENGYSVYKVLSLEE